MYDIAYWDHDTHIQNQLLFPSQRMYILSDASTSMFLFKVPLTKVERKNFLWEVKSSQKPVCDVTVTKYIKKRR
jgi:hypothetical protein